MQCSQCHSSMSQIDEVTEGNTRQTWYECQTCNALHTVSQPCDDPAVRIGSTQRYSAASSVETDLRPHNKHA